VEKFFVSQLPFAHNTYESPFPKTYNTTLQNAEVLIGRACAGELTAEDAMKQAAAFCDKTNNLM
jgi:hypothetical protein